MQNTTSLQQQIALTLISGVGDVLAKRLIAYMGSVEEVFKAKTSSLLKIPGIGQRLSEEIERQKTPALHRAESEITFIEKNKIKPIFYLSDQYPQRLKECDDAPILLFTKGDCQFNHRKVLSFIGTRNATERGLDVCAKLIKDLVEKNHDPIIISGLAYGIDICAHRMAIKHKLPTVAVLAHGLDQIYPATHRQVAQEITENGCLVTEFLSQTKMDRRFFLQRNRIIAGMADASIVVESADKGGALVTAEFANSYNRDVFAVPGRPGDKTSQGCNNLIKQNKAALIDSAEDIEKFLNWDIPIKKTKTQPNNQQQLLFTPMSEEETLIANLLKEHGNINIDIICMLSSIPMSRLSGVLLNLEFLGVVKSLPGKIYALI